MRRGGYRKLIAYDNLGEYLATADLSDSRLLRDLHAFAGRKVKRYLDLCVFHEDDVDLAEAVRAEALGFDSKT